MEITYELLTKENDSDIESLKKYHQLESIKKFIGISENYFNYVISSNNVFYYKIKIKDEIIGALHIEKEGETIYLSILIKPDKQQSGFASAVIHDVIDGKFNLSFNKIIASIDKENCKSINLFKKLGFTQAKQEDELLIFEFKNICFPQKRE